MAMMTTQSIFAEVAKGNNQQRDINYVYVAQRTAEGLFVLGWHKAKKGMPVFLPYEKCVTPLIWDYNDPTGLKKWLNENNLNKEKKLIIVRAKLMVGYNESFLNK